MDLQLSSLAEIAGLLYLHPSVIDADPFPERNMILGEMIFQPKPSLKMLMAEGLLLTAIPHG